MRMSSFGSPHLQGKEEGGQKPRAGYIERSLTTKTMSDQKRINSPLEIIAVFPVT